MYIAIFSLKCSINRLPEIKKKIAIFSANAILIDPQNLRITQDMKSWLQIVSSKKTIPLVIERFSKSN